MDLAKYSKNTVQVLSSSQKLAREKNHQAIEPEHLLSTLLTDEGGRGVLSALDISVSAVESKSAVELQKLPTVAGASNYLSPRFLKVTAAAETAATKLGSKLVNAAHLLAALADPSSGATGPGRILRDMGATKDNIEGLLRKAGDAGQKHPQSIRIRPLESLPSTSRRKRATVNSIRLSVETTKPVALSKFSHVAERTIRF